MHFRGRLWNVYIVDVVVAPDSQLSVACMHHYLIFTDTE